LRDDFDELSQFFGQARAENKKLIETIKSGGDVDLNYLKKQFLELYEKVGELTDCPVCFETLTKENKFVNIEFQKTSQANEFLKRQSE
jgi:hypothetical protein